VRSWPWLAATAREASCRRGCARFGRTYNPAAGALSAGNTGGGGSIENRPSGMQPEGFVHQRGHPPHGKFTNGATHLTARRGSPTGPPTSRQAPPERGSPTGFTNGVHQRGHPPHGKHLPRVIDGERCDVNARPTLHPNAGLSKSKGTRGTAASAWNFGRYNVLNVRKGKLGI
jgi:hypothetical protein